MSKKIEFPLNGEAYFKKGMVAFKQGKEKAALDYFNKANNLTDNSEVNFYYAFILSTYEKFDKSLKIMNQIKDFYINSERYSPFYTEMLIKNNNFLEAEYVIQKFKDNLNSMQAELWEDLEEELDEKRRAYNLEEETQKRELIKNLRNLPSYSSIIQSKKVQAAGILPLTDLQELAPIILANYQIDPKARRAFLELLIQQKDDNYYSFLWFDQIRKVCPLELPVFSEIQIVHHLKLLLEEKLSKLPNLYYLIESEIIHDLLLLYPYIDEVIKDIDFWIDLYIIKLDFYNHSKTSRMAVTEEELSMKKMIEYLHIISQRN